MKPIGKEFWATLITLVLTTSCALTSFLLERAAANDDFGDRPIKASIRLPRDLSRLLPGYNYCLLENLADKLGKTIEIDIENHPDSALAGLGDGSLDIVVLPFTTRDTTADNLEFIPVDSVSVWVVSKTHKFFIKKAIKFIDSYIDSDEYEQTRSMFLSPYNPFLSGRRSWLSPYDDLIKACADTVGCDWRFLAALIYQESNFHIEVRSRRGATGLMQLIPVTGKWHGAKNLYDPKQNISAGSRFLKNLRKQFASVSANSEEQMKIAIGAYNAGATRMRDCISVARAMNLNPGYWSNLAKAIPAMRDPSILNMVDLRCGLFYGSETIAYVNRITDIYKEFCRICPEQ